MCLYVFAAADSSGVVDVDFFIIKYGFFIWKKEISRVCKIFSFETFVSSKRIPVPDIRKNLSS